MGTSIAPEIIGKEKNYGIQKIYTYIRCAGRHWDKKIYNLIN